MRRIWIAVLCSLTASVAAAAGPLPTYDQVGLRWKDPPKVADMARFYPRRTAAAGIHKGIADVACTPNRGGNLQCSVIGESPENSGFGKAALQVMQRVSVRAVDGGDPAGRAFTFRLRFGRWGASTLPTGFQPGTELRWKVFPSMTDWDMKGQDRYETWKADFNCRARADGHIDCDLLGADPDAPRFAVAARKSLQKAQVKKIGGGSPEGMAFKWTVSVMRQNWCNKRDTRFADGNPSSYDHFTRAKGKADGLAAGEEDCLVSQVQTR
ncbi:MAG: hypothetical protein JWR84_3169 [Caulobacter sp.]|nr:hypothetical protein [Caulobacter sp.]